MTNIAKAIVRLREERRDGCSEPSPETWGGYFGSRKAYPRLGRNRARGDATSRQARSLRGRAPENFSCPESTLGQDQTDKESSLNVGRAEATRASARETEARRISARRPWCKSDSYSDSYQDIALAYRKFFASESL